MHSVHEMQFVAQDGMNFLTAKDLQRLLQVDRSTIYRMAESGRIPGVKIGRQWRFPAERIHRWLENHPTAGAAAGVKDSLIPSGCIRSIGDLVGEILGVMVVVTDMEGNPLAEPSNPCGLFETVNRRPGAVRRCVAAWRDLALDLDLAPRFVPSHLDLLCARSYLRVGSELRGIILAGGIAPADWPPSSDRVADMAADFDVEPEAISAHLDDVYHLDEGARQRVLDALPRLALFLSEVAGERTELLGKLEAIAALAGPTPT